MFPEKWKLSGEKIYLWIERGHSTPQDVSLSAKALEITPD
jgi:hypothetical protein